jgi:UDPglucose--hexose-1-phosphate uridylyltransferase
MQSAQNPQDIQIEYEIERLLIFAERSGLLEEEDVILSRNALLDLFKLMQPASAPIVDMIPDSAVPILENMLDYAASSGLLPDNNTTYRDLLDARIMGLLMPRASETTRKFKHLVNSDSVQAATIYFYNQSVASNYIRLDRVGKNQYWQTETEYGTLEITVNLSKPEKNPKEIALLKNAPASHYPKCLLCDENVGYAGRLNHPARQNHRIIPIELDGEPWYFQYSPYVYYNEHSIVLNKEHVPMKIGPSTFRRLIDFVEQFPHYFIGSNADLPIVGGSILNHDHFQAGRHVFAMEKASLGTTFTHPDYPEVKTSTVKWPLSVVRLSSNNKIQLLSAVNHIFAAWCDYSDKDCDIIAYSAEDRTPHNTVTPIARFNCAGEFEFDIVLRNNRTDNTRPEGIFHPRRSLHHIKQENIGLIEVMGLAVLPGRLKQEMFDIQQMLVGASTYSDGIAADPTHPLHKHGFWIDELINRYGTSMDEQSAKLLLQQEVGNKFQEVLSDAGVYKLDEYGSAGFLKFMKHVGFQS